MEFNDWLKNSIGSLIEIAAALLGFLAVAWTLYKEKKIKKIEFVSTYNFNFLTNDEFIAVERKLESFYQKVKNENAENITEIDKVKNALFNEVSNNECENYGINKNHQKVINYLVYLESFTPLIQREHVKLRDIDDLFGYRYFIAMNNPAIQRTELFPEAVYYQSCISIYGQWKKYRQDNHLPIPLAQYDLEKEAEKYQDAKRVLVFRKNGDRIEDVNDISFSGKKMVLLLKDSMGLATPSLSSPEGEKVTVKRKAGLIWRLRKNELGQNLTYYKLKKKDGKELTIALTFEKEQKDKSVDQKANCSEVKIRLTLKNRENKKSA